MWIFKRLNSLPLVGRVREGVKSKVTVTKNVTVTLLNQQGVVLLLALTVMIVMMAATATLVMRAIAINNATQRNNSSLQAYYEAEAGIACAYAEEARFGFKWYTHEDKDTRVSSNHDTIKGLLSATFHYPVGINISGGSIDPATGCYKIAGRNFLAKAFPEERDGSYTGIVVLRSQATVRGVTRTIEYRTNQVSVYQYFFFYPSDRIYDTDYVTYDGRNYGGIQVNGDILFKAPTNFNFLTKLSCGSNTPHKGYLRYPLREQYGDLTGVDAMNANRHFTNSFWNAGLATITLRTGSLSSPVDTKLEGYLEGDGAEWSFQKYSGTHTTAFHQTITNDGLKSSAASGCEQNWYPSDNTYGDILLLDGRNSINVPGVGSGTEVAIFKLMNSGTYPAIKWDVFWEQWKTNHQDDYAAFHSSGVLKEPKVYDNATRLTLNRDWERKCWMTNYGIYYIGWGSGLADGVPDGINREWWEDMEYGNDRAEVDYMAPAKFDNPASGLPEEKYFLNTEMQGPAWEHWLADNNLNAAGANQTLVQDRNTGGVYINPGKILGNTAKSNIIQQKALDAGIYIGIDETSNNFVNPIPDCTQATQFYNVQHPALNTNSKYRPNSVLKINVAALRSRIDSAKSKPSGERSPEEQRLANFNGVIYVDLTGYNWSGVGEHFDGNADGVMLYNAARLPDGGLSLGTPNNIYLKGDYNLDPDGVPEKNRNPDDTTVTSRYSGTALQWQPAEVISKRAIYTVSNTYPEPKYMPLVVVGGSDYCGEYYDEHDGGQSEYDFANSPSYPTNDHGQSTPNPYDDIAWVPAARSDISTDVNQWFQYYRDANGHPVAVPPYWTTKAKWDGTNLQRWIDYYWGGATFYFDTNGDGIKETTISSTNLRYRPVHQINSAFNDTFNYPAIHGADGSLNLETPSQLNIVNQKQIYNTAILTPYSTDCYVLECWRPNGINGVERAINGAFIQLPDTPEYKLSIPQQLNSWTNSRINGGYYGQTPNNIYVYESRYGRNADQADIPRAGLTFGADSSWRERKNVDF